MYVFPVRKIQMSDHSIDVKTVVLASLYTFHQSSKHAYKVMPVYGDGCHEAIQDQKKLFQFCCCFPISAGDYGSKMLEILHHNIIYLLDRTVPCQGGL